MANNRIDCFSPKKLRHSDFAVQSRRPASQASAGINPLFLGDFLSDLRIFLSS